MAANETTEDTPASLRDRIDRDHAAVMANCAKLTAGQAALSEKIESAHIALRDQIDQLRHRMDDRYATLIHELSEKIERTNVAVAHLAGMQKVALCVLAAVCWVGWVHLL